MDDPETFNRLLLDFLLEESSAALETLMPVLILRERATTPGGASQRGLPEPGSAL
jgi:hypothetical protein